VRIWDTTDLVGLEDSAQAAPGAAHYIKDHGNSVCSVAFSPSGAHIVSGATDRTVYVWDAVRFVRVGELRGFDLSGLVPRSLPVSDENMMIRSRTLAGAARRATTIWFETQMSQKSMWARWGIDGKTIFCRDQRGRFSTWRATDDALGEAIVLCDRLSKAHHAPSIVDLCSFTTLKSSTPLLHGPPSR
jgi:WD40 repeat protein